MPFASRGDLPGRSRGTVVAMPSLNPAGLRTTSRTAYYDRADPNRTFPLPERETKESDGTPPTVYEQTATMIWAQIKPRAEILLDLHNASIQSVPFTIRDRVLYDGETDKARRNASGEVGQSRPRLRRRHRQRIAARRVA